MSRHLSKPAGVLLIVCAAILGFAVALQIFFESPAVEKITDKYAAEYIDGDLSFSDIRVSVLGAFPKLRVRVDSLSLTYPHERFPDDAPLGDSLCLAGRGAVSDTLLAFDRLSVTLAPFRLLFGNLTVSRCAIHGLSVYAHTYPDSAANWQIFKIPVDTASAKGAFMPVVIRDFTIDRHPDIVYTDSRNGLFADLGLNSLGFGGTLATKDGFGLKGANLRLDADPVLSAGSMDKMKLPVRLDARVGISRTGDSLDVRIPSFNASLAHIPVVFSGRVGMMPDRTFVSGKGSVDSLNIGTILRQYGAALTPLAPYFTTDSKLNLSFKAHGFYGNGSLPEIKARLSIPESGVCYVPRDMDGRLALDCKLSSDGDRLDASFDRMSLAIPGVSVTMTGTVNDILSPDPSIKANLTANTVLDKLTKYILHDGGIDAFGNLNLAFSANAHLSELKSMSFDKSTMGGHISSDRLKINLPYSDLKVNAYKTDIRLSSGPAGMGMGVRLDSAYCYAGFAERKLAARVRKCNVLVDMSTVSSHGSLIPRSVVKIGARSAFVRTDATKAILNGTDVYLDCMKKSRRVFRHGTDSVRRMDFAAKLPSLDSTGKPVPPADDRLLKIRLDSLIIAEMMNWNTEGRVNLDNGFVATPVFPLRSRIGKVKLSFDDNNLKIDTLSLRAGTSDVRLKGNIGGLRRYSKQRGPLSVVMDIDSRHLNVNELVSAMQSGKREKVDTSLAKEMDESFVKDNLADSHPDKDKVGSMKSYMLPSDIIGTLNVNLANVNYLDYVLSPVCAEINLNDRVLQIKDARTDIGFGKFGANAYYSTKSADDIAIGVDAYARDVQINPAMRLVRGYDDFEPILKSIDGKVGIEACIMAGLDPEMNVKPSTVSGVSRINGEDIFISDIGSLRRLTKLLFFKNKDIGHIDDFHIDAMAHDGKFEVFPFIISADKYKVALQGIQGLDGSMNYYASVLKSPFLIPFGVKVYGDFKKCRLGLGVPRYVKKDVPQFTAQVDSMQINIARAIDRIYKDGIRQVEMYNSRSNRNLQYYKGTIGYDDRNEAAAVSSGSVSGRLVVKEDSGSATSKLDTNMLKQEFMRIRQEYQQRKQMRQSNGKH